MVNQSEHKRRSLFNLEGAIERLCTFKKWKREDKNSGVLPKVRQRTARVRVTSLYNLHSEYGGVAQLGEHLPCKQGVRSSILLISTKGRRKTKKRRPSPQNFMGL